MSATTKNEGTKVHIPTCHRCNQWPCLCSAQVEALQDAVDTSALAALAQDAPLTLGDRIRDAEYALRIIDSTQSGDWAALRWAADAIRELLAALAEDGSRAGSIRLGPDSWWCDS